MVTEGQDPTGEGEGSLALKEVRYIEIHDGLYEVTEVWIITDISDWKQPCDLSWVDRIHRPLHHGKQYPAYLK